MRKAQQSLLNPFHTCENWPTAGRGRERELETRSSVAQCSFYSPYTSPIEPIWKSPKT